MPVPTWQLSESPMRTMGTKVPAPHVRRQLRFELETGPRPSAFESLLEKGSFVPRGQVAF